MFIRSHCGLNAVDKGSLRSENYSSSPTVIFIKWNFALDTVEKKSHRLVMVYQYHFVQALLIRGHIGWRLLIRHHYSSDIVDQRLFRSDRTLLIRGNYGRDTFDHTVLLSRHSWSEVTFAWILFFISYHCSQMEFRSGISFSIGISVLISSQCAPNYLD